MVDEDLETGTQTRRFLAYDVMLLNGKPCTQLPFEVPCNIVMQVKGDSRHINSSSFSRWPCIASAYWTPPTPLSHSKSHFVGSALNPAFLCKTTIRFDGHAAM